MSIKTTTNPLNGQKPRKNTAKKVDAKKLAKSQAVIEEPELTVEEELGPLAYYTPAAENAFLRQMFDFLESINFKNGRKIYYSVPPRVWNICMGVVAFVVLIGITLSLINVALARLAWENRPTVVDRLAGPYGIDTHPTPNLDLSIESGVLPQTVGGFTLEIPASGLANVTTTLIGSDGVRFDAVTRGLLGVNNAMSQCVLSTAGATTSECGALTFARYAEAMTYVSGSDTVTVAVAQYANIEQTGEIFNHIFQYSRTIGGIGNYAILDRRSVDYFYNSAYRSYHFTWTNGTWIYTVSSTSLGAIDGFMANFPY
jgi:hypothetical protein